ncbi:MAG: metalloregulator ArsR/SmtB family transcription factor [Chloroflexota bacterium]
MARARTTSDVFNAVAEPQRRQLLELLIAGEQTVNDIAKKLDMRQPQASKHLRVLREVDLVRVRQEGKQRFYTLESSGLKPMFDWLMPFEQLLQERYDRLDTYLQQLQHGEKNDSE